MDYTSGSGTAAIAVGGTTLAYTGAGDVSWIALLVGAILVVLGVALLAVMKYRNGNDAQSAGVTPKPLRRNKPQL